MILLVRQELFKLSRRFTPYLLYAAILLLVGLIVLGHRRDGNWAAERISRDDFQVLGDPRNAVFICQFVLMTVARLLPFLAPIVVGEILGGEAGSGTLRTMLVRPRSRLAIWSAKYIAAFLYTLSLTVFMMLLSYGLGALVFGRGQLWEFNALQDGRLMILTESEALVSLALAYGVLTFAVFVTASLAFALASFFDSGLAPGFTALGILVTVQIIEVMPFDWVEAVRPWLFTTYLGDYDRAFPQTFDPGTQALVFPFDAVAATLRSCLAWIAAFSGVGLWRFLTRDVTC